jgi:hypothetical protein
MQTNLSVTLEAGDLMQAGRPKHDFPGKKAYRRARRKVLDTLNNARASPRLLRCHRCCEPPNHGRGHSKSPQRVESCVSGGGQTQAFNEICG